MQAVALVAFGVFAVLDWLAVSRSVRSLEYVAKPATLLALLVYAGSGHPSPSRSATVGDPRSTGPYTA